jgi:hypothetical protein
MDQFKWPYMRRKRPDPQTPLPPFASDRYTDRLKRQEYFRKLTETLDENRRQTSAPDPAITKFELNGLENHPHLLVYGSICHHIDLRSDKAPPHIVFISHANYLRVVEFLSRQSQEGFTGKYFFPAYDGTESIPIKLCHDAMPNVSESIPANIAYCVHWERCNY